MSRPAPTSRAEEAWQESRDQLLAFIARRVPTYEDAEDILQEVMLRIHRDSDALQRADNMTGWIYRIAANAVVDQARREIVVGGPVDVPEPRFGDHPGRPTSPARPSCVASSRTAFLL
jgi:DNA-directed RNA polymerase specialized sigma24 family protein